MTRARTSRRARRGISLMEVMVAVSLLALVSGSLASLMISAAQRANLVSGTTYRNAIMQQETNRLSVLPYDSLPARVGCISLSALAAPYPYIRCISVDSVGPQQRRVTVMVRLVNPAFRPDTVQMERTRPYAGNPFNTP